MGKQEEAGTLTFKGRPLVRSGKTIYYGDMGDKYVAVLQILGESPLKDQMIPNKVSVQILATDEDLRPRERIVKKTEKPTLYDALTIASIWLERQLAQS